MKRHGRKRQHESQAPGKYQIWQRKGVRAAEGLRCFLPFQRAAKAHGMERPLRRIAAARCVCAAASREMIKRRRRRHSLWKLYLAVRLRLARKASCRKTSRTARRSEICGAPLLPRRHREPRNKSCRRRRNREKRKTIRLVEKPLSAMCLYARGFVRVAAKFAACLPEELISSRRRRLDGRRHPCRGMENK